MANMVQPILPRDMRPSADRRYSTAGIPGKRSESRCAQVGPIRGCSSKNIDPLRMHVRVGKQARSPALRSAPSIRRHGSRPVLVILEGQCASGARRGAERPTPFAARNPRKGWLIQARRKTCPMSNTTFRINTNAGPLPPPSTSAPVLYQCARNSSSGSNPPRPRAALRGRIAESLEVTSQQAHIDGSAFHMKTVLRHPRALSACNFAFVSRRPVSRDHLVNAPHDR